MLLIRERFLPCLVGLFDLTTDRKNARLYLRVALVSACDLVQFVCLLDVLHRELHRFGRRLDGESRLRRDVLQLLRGFDEGEPSPLVLFEGVGVLLCVFGVLV